MIYSISLRKLEKWMLSVKENLMEEIIKMRNNL